MAWNYWNKSDSDSFCEYSDLEFSGSEFGSLSESEYEDEEQFQENIYKLQQEKLKLFQSQNPEIGHFDVLFDFDGKLLYANKYVLVTSSETLNAWLSDRWTKDENPIKIETYTFDIFYQFCSFLYSGNCKVTKENTFQLVDAAEFFGIQLLKNHCEKFIKQKRQKLVNEENFFEMVKIAEKYSLLEFTKYLDYQLYKNHESLIDENEMNFLGLSKSRIIALCKNQKESRKYEVFEEEFFKTMYEVAEKSVLKKQKNNSNETFNEKDAIKEELAKFLPKIRFYLMDKKFLKDSVVEITNEKCTLNGIFEDNLNISNAVGKNSVEIFSYKELKQRFIRFKFPRPSTPSGLIKKNGIQWYLCLEWDGILAAKHQSLITETDFLIAELSYVYNNFRITKNTNTYLKITRF
uniref:BTB domain-containing protein n=1 Tax=Panagrolaimus davidi TaxID=227884 RepID=A0A914P904_9BILA